MKRIILGLGISLILSGITIAQTTKSKTASSAGADQSASVGSRITESVHVSGELQNSLDVRRAKVGDEVLLKTTDAVKQKGRTIIAKGSTLAGRVTSVQKQVKGNANSSIGVMFDSVRQGGSRMPISAVITSVVAARTAASMTDDEPQFDTAGSSSTQASTRSSSGGLLGGVTNSVGSVVNTTTQTAGSVVDTTGRTVSRTTTTAGSTVRGLTISQSTSASAQGGSTLNMSGGNLRLDKGTTFDLAVTASSQTSIAKD